MSIPARSRGAIEIQARRARVYRRLVLPAQAFLHTAGLSGIVLLIAAVAAVAWANSPWAAHYFRIQQHHLGLDVGVLRLDATVQHWINDALMTIFFFVVGLEIKRELVRGELCDPRRAALPILAAAGGMLAPAALYAALNAGTAGLRGWGVPMATDIAFAVGVLTVLGDRIPASARVFLLALAIVDDIGAILVIALFYAHGLSLTALAAAAALVIVVLLFQFSGVRAPGLYAILGIALWLMMSLSGVHATLAGVVLGLLTPARSWLGLDGFSAAAHDLLWRYDAELALDRPEGAEVVLGGLEELCRETEPPLERWERMLHPWSSYVVLPLFAFWNAGVALDRESLRAALSSRVALGVVVGLVAGKAIGVLGASWAAVRLGLARLPQGATWAHVGGVAILAGIGFTVSLFITDLAFTAEDDLNAAKIGILAASVLAGLLGYAYLRWTTPAVATAADPEG